MKEEIKSLKESFVIEQFEACKLNFTDLSGEANKIFNDLRSFCSVPGPSRCIAKLSRYFDPRIGKDKEFPMFERMKHFIIEVNNENHDKSKLILFQDYGNIILLSGFREEPSLNEIKNIPIVLLSHADEITYFKKMDSEIIPLFNESPLKEQLQKEERKRILNPKVSIYGFDGVSKNREFKRIGSGEIHIELIKSKNAKNKGKDDKDKAKFYINEKDVGLINIERPVKVGDLVIQDYDKSSDFQGLDSIIHAKALDDRVGVVSHLHTMRELNKLGIKAKAIFVGDEEGPAGPDIAWAKLTRPVFRKYCNEENIIILCDGFDGKKLSEFYRKNTNDENSLVHLDEALIVSYRSKGKGAGDPGFFAMFRDEIVNFCKEKGFNASITTDYVSRSMDPKIMDDFPIICSIDWSNGPIVKPTTEYFNVCHVDESVSLRQVINIIGTTFWTVLLLYRKINNY